jgi:hypothetical protein
LPWPFFARPARVVGEGVQDLGNQLIKLISFFMRSYKIEKRRKPTKFVKEYKTMRDNSLPSIEDILCTDDCWDCPYFSRLDICGYAYAAELISEGSDD